MRVRIGGKYWDLVYEQLPRGTDGLCDPPTKPHKKIRLDRSLLRNDAKHLDTLLHEVIHAEQWWLDEDYVAEAASDMARILIKLGWRFLPDGTQED